MANKKGKLARFLHSQIRGIIASNRRADCRLVFIEEIKIQRTLDHSQKWPVSAAIRVGIGGQS
jgi:hypothetical protein